MRMPRFLRDAIRGKPKRPVIVGPTRAELNTVIRAGSDGIDSQFTLYSLGILHDWHPTPFKLHDLEFPTMQHYMAWRRAMLFKDTRIAAEIMIAPGPSDAKKLSWKVQGFDDIAWYCAAKAAMFQGCYKGKYAQHALARKTLLDTRGTILVEASEADTVWGIALPEYDKRSFAHNEWRGTNWSGETQTMVREKILADMAAAANPRPR